MIVLDVILKLSAVCLVACISVAAMIFAVAVAEFLRSLAASIERIEDNGLPIPEIDLDVVLHQADRGPLDYNDPFLVAQRERIQKKAAINEERKLRKDEQ